MNDKFLEWGIKSNDLLFSNRMLKSRDNKHSKNNHRTHLQKEKK